MWSYFFKPLKSHQGMFLVHAGIVRIPMGMKLTGDLPDKMRGWLVLCDIVLNIVREDDGLEPFQRPRVHRIIISPLTEYSIVSPKTISVERGGNSLSLCQEISPLMPAELRLPIKFYNTPRKLAVHHNHNFKKPR